jgi:hypothetical protein
VFIDGSARGAARVGESFFLDKRVEGGLILTQFDLLSDVIWLRSEEQKVVTV